jgi:hypothetical protein
MENELKHINVVPVHEKIFNTPQNSTKNGFHLTCLPYSVFLLLMIQALARKIWTYIRTWLRFVCYYHVDYNDMRIYSTIVTQLDVIATGMSVVTNRFKTNCLNFISKHQNVNKFFIFCNFHVNNSLHLMFTLQSHVIFQHIDI